MARILQLKATEPVAKGGRRLVFAHPDDPRLIIKVLQPAYLKREWPEPLTWRRKLKRYRRYFGYLQEVREHLAACTHYGTRPKHLQNLVGFIDTDYGLGLIYEPVLGPGGKFAPTLQSLLTHKLYTREIQQAYNEYRDWLINAPITVTDLRSDNIVCARDETGKPYFVQIDGVGEKTLVPIKGFVPWLNRRSKIRNLRKFEARTKFPAEPDPG
jgi:hypothetical protein